MDREPEELQFLGLFGLYRKALHIVTSWRRLFGQIAVALVLPLSFLFLAQVGISYLLFSSIDRSDALTSAFISLLLFKAAYLLALLVLSLLSTATVVYTVASIYTANVDLSSTKVMAVVPKVWRCLMAVYMEATV